MGEAEIRCVSRNLRSFGKVAQFLDELPWIASKELPPRSGIGVGESRAEQLWQVERKQSEAQDT